METIVVPVDFSPVTERILYTTIKIARHIPSRVWLIHIVPLDGAPTDYEAGPQVVRDTIAKNTAQSHTKLQEMSQRLRSMQIDATWRLIEGDIIDKIDEHIKKQHADLVIMGTHGHGAFYKFIMGSISEGLLPRLQCPVILVPSRN